MYVRPRVRGWILESQLTALLIIPGVGKHIYRSL